MDKKDSYVQLDIHYQTIKETKTKSNNKAQVKKEVSKEVT
jgi:hypothetical protein